MRDVDLSLYLVTDTRLCGGPAGVVETVAAAVAAGVTVVQLRDPAVADDALVALGRQVAQALRGTGVPLVLNDRVHLVDAVGAHGAHIGQSDGDPREARRVLGPDRLLGVSVSSVAEALAAQRLGPGVVDHLGVGPVWPQSTKPDAAPPLGPDGLAAAVAATTLPCVAIGGVDVARIAAVRAAGAAGAAVVSAICGRPDAAGATRDLRRAWDDARVPA